MSSIFLLISKKKCDIIKYNNLKEAKIELKIKVLGVSFDAVNKKEASAQILSAIQNKNKIPFTHYHIRHKKSRRNKKRYKKGG